MLKPTQSSLINITPVPLRTAAPSILRSTPAFCDVITRLHAVFALQVSSSVFSFYSFFPPTMDLSRPFLLFGFISEPHFLATPPRGLRPWTGVNSKTQHPFPFSVSVFFCPGVEFSFASLSAQTCSNYQPLWINNAPWLWIIIIFFLMDFYIDPTLKWWHCALLRRVCLPATS